MFNPADAGPVIYGIQELHDAILDLSAVDGVVDELAKVPLVAFLEGGADAFAVTLRDPNGFKPEALRACYEAALGFLNIPQLVKEVETRVVEDLLAGRDVSPLELRGLESIETIVRIYDTVFPRYAIAEFVLRRAVKDHAALVVLFGGMKQALLVFNLSFPQADENGPYKSRDGGKFYLDWYYYGV